MTVVLAALGCFVVCLAAGLGGAPGLPGGRGMDGQGRAVILAALAQIVCGALLGLGAGWLAGATALQSAGLALAGAAPGTVAASPLAAVAGGQPTRVQAMAVAGTFLSVLSITAVQIVAGAGAGSAALLVLIAALPVFLGLTLRDRFPAALHRVMPVLSGLVLGAMIAAALIGASPAGPVLPLLGGALLLAVALTLAGRFLGGGLDATMPIALPMRNVAVPIAAAIAAGQPGAAFAAAVYGVVMYLPPLAVLILRLRAARR